MKVMHILKTSTGATWALRQIKLLKDNGVDVEVILPKGGPLIEELDKLNIKHYDVNPELPVTKPWNVVRNATLLKKMIIESHPDILHSHFWSPSIFLRFIAKANVDIPRIFQVPGPLHLENLFFKRIDVLTARKKDYWIATSNYIKSIYRASGVPDDKIFLIYYSPDLNKFNFYYRYDLKRELGLKPSSKLLGLVAYFYPPKLYLGHIRGIKGHEDLIDALAICRKYRDDIFCVFAGGAYKSNRYMERLRKYANRKCGSAIKFIGERKDVPKILAGLDIAIVPSLSENFGGVGEALLSEVPTIATNVGGIPELIKNEVTGLLVEKKNPKMLAEAILKCLNNYEAYKRMAKHGRERVLELCDPNKNIHLLLDAYKHILFISNKKA